VPQTDAAELGESLRFRRSLSVRTDKLPLTGSLLGERIAMNLSLRNDKFFGVEGALSQLALQTVGLM
jgi:hypothetical protein